MGDYISEFSRAQADFAQKCVAKFIRETLRQTKLKKRLGDGLFVAFTAEVHKDMTCAMQAYARWLACKLVRSNNFQKQAMPDWDQKSMVLVSEKSGVKIMYLAVFIELFTQPNTKLPLIGKITSDRELIPDEVALMQYKASLGPW